MTSDFLTVETYRGEIREIESRIAAVVIDRRGRVLERFAPHGFRVSPRSSVKVFQAIPYVTSGAFQKEGANLERLALACSSHQGEDMHVQEIRAWLSEYGLGESALFCGPHPPDHQASAEALIRTMESPSKFHNNCSGKHAAMLATCRHLGEPVGSYSLPESSCQARVIRVFEDFFNENPHGAARGIDGCGLPTYECDFEGLALAWLRLIEPPRDEYVEPCRLILESMRVHPLLIEGTGSFTSSVIEHTQGEILLKVGAAGVYAGVSPKQGVAFAFKCLDGQFLPLDVAVLDFLKRFGLVGVEVARRVERETIGRPKNWSGATIGHRTVVMPSK